jgi:hypothetical protein
MLKELASKIGVKVKNAPKRGEVILFFAIEGNGLSLKLSQKKALKLVYWIANKLSEEGKK